MRPACLTALRGVAASAPRTMAFITTALSLLLGFLVFYLAQELTAVDALCLYHCQSNPMPRGWQRLAHVEYSLRSSLSASQI